MSPKEHALSQSVLEFLIAQQDWFMLDIAPPPEGSPTAPWNSRVSRHGGFEGKWKEGTQSREGSREGTPNVNMEPGPSVQRGQLGPSRNPHPQPQPQPHVQAPLPKHVHTAQFQQSQVQPLPQPQSQPQSQQPQYIPQRQGPDLRPSTSFRTSDYGSDVDDVMIIPNSEEEYDDDWKLVSPIQGGSGGRSKVAFRGDREKEKATKSMRRRTVVDRSGEVFVLPFLILIWLLILINFFSIFTRSSESSCSLA